MVVPAKEIQMDFERCLKRLKVEMDKLASMPPRSKGRTHQMRLVAYWQQQTLDFRNGLARTMFAKQVNEAADSIPGRRYPHRVTMLADKVVKDGQIEPYTWAIENLTKPMRVFHQVREGEHVYIVAFACKTEAAAFRIMWG